MCKMDSLVVYAIIEVPDLLKHPLLTVDLQDGIAERCWGISKFPTPHDRHHSFVIGTLASQYSWKQFQL